MTDYWQLLVAFACAVNPCAVALAWAPAEAAAAERRRWIAATGAATAAALLVIAVFAADALLDFLDVEPESFGVAAGTVFAAAGVQGLIQPLPVQVTHPARWAGIVPLGLPLLATPAALAAAVSFGVDAGEGKTLGTAAPALLVASIAFALVPRGARPYCDAGARVLAALLVAIGAGLVVDGVRSI